MDYMCTKRLNRRRYTLSPISGTFFLYITNLNASYFLFNLLFLFLYLASFVSLVTSVNMLHVVGPARRKEKDSRPSMNDKRVLPVATDQT